MRLFRLVVLTIALAWMGKAIASDSSIRVSFLLNFSRFADWPEAAMKPSRPLTYCIAPGDPEMAADLSRLDMQELGSRSLSVTKVTQPGDALRCNVLYLPADLPGDFAPWLAVAEQASLLTVSDRLNFIDDGGMIGLIQVSGRYRFEINLASARRAGIHLGSNLLKLALRVR
jgi:hypothetical protein